MPRSSLARHRTGRAYSLKPLSTPSRRAFLKASAALLGTGVAGVRRVAHSADAYPHLSNRTVTMLVGSDVGGGFDLCGRTLARHMEGLVPGLRIEIKNVGQASGKLAAKMLQEGPTDGGMLLTSAPSLLSAQLLGEEGVAYDLQQWGWLGKVATETYLLVKGPGADFADLKQLKTKRTPSSMSVRSSAAFTYHLALWLNAMLGLRIKPVPGYKAMERDAALLQGEVMLTVQTHPTDRQMLELPEVDVVLRVTAGDVPERFRDRPLLADLVADRPALSSTLAFIDASVRLSRWFAAPPKTDPAVLAEWRDVFDVTMASAGFRSDAGKLDFKVEPMSGMQVSDLVGQVLADQKNLSAQLQSALECGKAMVEGLDSACSQS